MRRHLVRWLRVLTVAGPAGACGVCSPVEGCASAMAQPPAKPAPAQPPAAPAVAATVNGEVITLDQVDAVLRRRPVAAHPLTPGQVQQLRLAVVDGLADDLLLKQHLRQHGPKVDPAEVDAHVKALAAALARLNKTPADYLRELGLTEQHARDTWQTLIAWTKYVDRYATDAELRKYHAAHREVFDGVTVKARQIVLRVGPSAPPGERTAARERLAAVRADILSGAVTFADAARKHSVDPSASTGGELGELTRLDPMLDEPVLAAAFALKPGELSQPVDGEFGVHLIQTTARSAGTPTPFEKVVEQVRDCFSDELRQNLVAKLRKDAVIRVTVP
ncbi:MAG: peptidylprolyl isomerase [Gemmataceae bacterium]